MKISFQEANERIAREASEARNSSRPEVPSYTRPNPISVPVPRLKHRRNWGFKTNNKNSNLEYYSEENQRKIDDAIYQQDTDIEITHNHLIHKINLSKTAPYNDIKIIGTGKPRDAKLF